MNVSPAKKFNYLVRNVFDIWSVVVFYCDCFTSIILFLKVFPLTIFIFALNLCFRSLISCSFAFPSCAGLVKYIL